MRLCEGRGDSAFRDLTDRCDLAVREIGEVAKEHDEPSPRWQRADCVTHRAVRPRVLDGEVGRLVAPRGREVAAHAQRLVHRDPPYPRLEVRVAAKPPPAAQRPRERLLDDLAGRLGIAHDARNPVEEHPVAASIEPLELGSRRPHLHLYRSPRTPFPLAATFPPNGPRPAG